MTFGYKKWAGGAASLSLGLFLLAVVAVSPQGTRAQEFGLPDSAIYVLDPNRLFSETAFGLRMQAELKQRHDAISEENRRIEGELSMEESQLTEQRPDMDPGLFRKKADAFDEKVRRIRAEQEAKRKAWQADADNAFRRFLTVSGPILEEMMSESGAAILVDVRSVMWRAQGVDVTDEAVRRFDQAIGDGKDILKDPASDAVPDPAPIQPDQQD